MSLFGTLSETSISASQGKQSLFDDDEPKAEKHRASNSYGLFSTEDDTLQPSDSPWSFGSRKQKNAVIIRSLLPSTEVPDSYVEAYDAFIDAARRSSNGASISALVNLFKDMGLNFQEIEKILKLIKPTSDLATGGEEHVDRGEFNVALALVGLTQEGEEVSLDSVDERRGRLPKPRLPLETLGLKSSSANSAQAAYENSISRMSGPKFAADRSRGPGQSFNALDSDPWGSPQQQRMDAAPANTIHRDTSSLPVPTTEHTLRETRSGSSSWMVYSENYTNTNETGVQSGFGGQSTTNEEGNLNATRPTRPLSRQYQQSVEEKVTVVSLPDKEGMFLFQYRNYEVASARRNSKVIRRYSDFVWLLDCLHKKYPFRQLPLLPPKRVAINGNHISADNFFIEKRRRGLVRFVNALVRHPVLTQEQLVIMFLTVPTELSAWRKQAVISIAEEFTGKQLPVTLEDSLPPGLDDLFNSVRSGVQRSAMTYVTLCAILERLIKRKEGLAAEMARFSSTLLSLNDTSMDTYKLDTNSVPLLNEGIKCSSRHVETHSHLLEEEAKTWDEGVFEDFKSIRDRLVSMQDMFDRRERLTKDNIPALERRISANENKLATVRAKQEATRKPGEAEKLEEAIVKDKELIVQQHARQIFIKECIRDEISHFQTSQYQISRIHQDWAQEGIKYAELHADCWKGWADDVEGMPSGADDS